MRLVAYVNAGVKLLFALFFYQQNLCKDRQLCFPPFIVFAPQENEQKNEHTEYRCHNARHDVRYIKHARRDDSIKMVGYDKRRVFAYAERLAVARGRGSIIELEARRVIEIVLPDRDILVHRQHDLYDVVVPEGKRRVVVQRCVLLDAVFSPGVFIGKIRALNSQRKHKFF